MYSATHEVLAFGEFPNARWPKIWSTNPLERINKEVKRRSRVVGLFPNQASVIRRIGAVHDEWPHPTAATSPSVTLERAHSASGVLRG